MGWKGPLGASRSFPDGYSVNCVVEQQDPLPNQVHATDELVKALREHREVLVRALEADQDWKLRLRMGAVQGLGTVIGATVVVSLMIWILGFATQWDPVKPVAERIILELRQEGPVQEEN